MSTLMANDNPDIFTYRENNNMAGYQMNEYVDN